MIFLNYIQYVNKLKINLHWDFIIINLKNTVKETKFLKIFLMKFGLRNKKNKLKLILKC